MAENLVPLKLSAGVLLSVQQFQRLADVPPEAQWFASLDSKQTRCAFLAFTAATGSGNWPLTFKFESPDATCDASSLGIS